MAELLSHGVNLLWAVASTAVVLAAALTAAGHAILYKRDSRSAVAWVGLIMLVPLLGAALYALLGVNRVRRRAVALRARNRHALAAQTLAPTEQAAEQALPQVQVLAGLLTRVTGDPLLRGNHIAPLDNGDEAYPAMLAAIEGAEHSVCLSTYIFETQAVGARFVDALAGAHARGVQVRVLLDAVGRRYAHPYADDVLRARGVPVALFMPVRTWGFSRYFNLRNHRKLLIVDGRLGFTGGMNIRVGHVLAEASDHPVRDLHFSLTGPIVRRLAEVFAEDWEFATGECLTGEPWLPNGSRAAANHGLGETDGVAARAVVDGPDGDLDTFRWALMGGLACAAHSVRVVTPYFLPDSPLMTALELAALRGVRVDVVLPREGNLKLVQWAMQAHLSRHGKSSVRYWLSPAPFDHTKLLVVDGAWTLLGSANWDPRSLRLNFELGVEVYDEDLAHALETRVDERISRAERLDVSALQRRPILLQLRDGIARLMKPYL